MCGNEEQWSAAVLIAGCKLCCIHIIALIATQGLKENSQLLFQPLPPLFLPTYPHQLTLDHGNLPVLAIQLQI